MRINTNQAGGSRLNFLIVMVIIGSAAYAGYLYIPVAYDAYLYKDLMQHNVDVAAAQGYPAAWVSDQLTKNAAEFGIPADAVITPALRDNRMEVRVQFTRPIEFLHFTREFPGYTFEYEFDYTARSTAFLTFK